MESKKHEHHHKNVRIKKSEIWKSTTTILAILLIVSLYFNFNSPASAGQVLSPEEAADKAISYINTNLMQPGVSAKQLGVEENSDLYNVKLDIAGNEYDSYVTKDGKLLFPTVIDMTEQAEQPTQDPTSATQEPAAVKSEKPTVELFVMSHCPYGTQSEKGIIPVVELLGDKIDFELKFVNYAMHGEVEVNEQLQQYCIDKEEPDKFLDYLKCFLKEGNSEECIEEASIDTAKLEGCTEATDEEYKITETLNDQASWETRFPPFSIHDEENDEYGIRGSPSLVINGKMASSGRSPAAYLATICNSFIEPPEECSQELAAETPSPGFGYEVTDSPATGQC